jgi:hypothetical protein
MGHCKEQTRLPILGEPVVAKPYDNIFEVIGAILRSFGNMQGFDQRQQRMRWGFPRMMNQSEVAAQAPALPGS